MITDEDNSVLGSVTVMVAVMAEQFALSPFVIRVVVVPEVPTLAKDTLSTFISTFTEISSGNLTTRSYS